MVYAKGVMSGIAAVYLGLILPAFLNVFKGLSEQKATGLGAISGGFIESILSPWFWLFALSFFAVFFITGRAHNKFLRVIFFWIPTVFVSSVAILSVGLFSYLRILAERS